jgi:N-acyl-D-amino-acid deacylase
MKPTRKGTLYGLMHPTSTESACPIRPKWKNVVVVRVAVRLATFAFAFIASCVPAEPPSSTLLRNALIIDGTGAPARRGDVRVSGDRIAAVGQLTPLAGERVMDALGLALAPGLIDTHSHHDRGLATNRDALAMVSQGVTTIVIGQDGGGSDLGATFARLDTQSVAVNVASYAGHGSLRTRVMGEDFKRHATAAEIDSMKTLLEAEMRAGALGLSSGLEYDPGIYSSPAEVLELARVAGRMGGRYISHIRSEDRWFWSALDEIINIGRETGMPVQVSHLKLGMRDLWGQTDSLMSTLDRARGSGVQITADIYPYTHWQSNLGVLYPKRNFADSAETAFVLEHVAVAKEIIFNSFRDNPDYVGKTLAQIANLRGTSEARTLMDLLAEPGGVRAGIVAKGMDERDVERLLQWPFANVCSDGTSTGLHPRGFGSFAKVLGPFARDRKLFSIEEAIRKMTSLAATNMGFADRGRIEPGYFADLVLFDPSAVADRADFGAAQAQAVGVHTVWVNGTVVFENGKTTGTFPGRALRHMRSDYGEDAPPRQEALDSVERYIAAEMARQKIPGISVAILRGDSILLARGYGLANVELRVPATDSTIYQSGSMGKQFTATAVVMLAEQGKVRLDDAITKWLPEGRGKWDGVTVRHLLTHTGGIPEYTGGGRVDFRKDYTENELVKMAAGLPLDFQPGDRWRYSNAGYLLLGAIIHRVTGRFYGDVLQDFIFKPLGMSTTRVISESDIVPNRSAGYRLVDGVLKNQNWVSPSLNTTADGALYYTVRDLTKWAVALNHKRLPSAAGLDLMWTPVNLNNGTTHDYGFGWVIGNQNGHLRIGHGGGWQGFRTAIERYPEFGLTVIALANLAQATPGTIVTAIAEMVEPELREQARRAP